MVEGVEAVREEKLEFEEDTDLPVREVHVVSYRSSKCCSFADLTYNTGSTIHLVHLM